MTVMTCQQVDLHWGSLTQFSISTWLPQWWAYYSVATMADNYLLSQFKIKHKGE